MAGIIETGIGALGAITGGLLGGSSASRRKRQLDQLAETPGVDVSGATGDALAGREANFERASNVARQQNTFDQQEMERMLEESIPGYKGIQSTRSGNAASFLKGDIPDDVRAQVFRRGAAKAVGGGYGGSDASRNLTARDLGLTSLDLMDRGQRYSQSIIGGTPMARLSTTSELSGVNPGDVLGLRSKERSEKLGLKRASIEGPGASDVWGDFATQTGGTLLGAGLGSLGSSKRRSSSGGGMIWS